MNNKKNFKLIMKNVKFDNNKSKRVMSKKEFGLQINLGEQLEEKVKNYTILLKKKKIILKIILNQKKFEIFHFILQVQVIIVMIIMINF